MKLYKHGGIPFSGIKVNPSGKAKIRMQKNADFMNLEMALRELARRKNAGESTIPEVQFVGGGIDFGDTKGGGSFAMPKGDCPGGNCIENPGVSSEPSGGDRGPGFYENLANLIAAGKERKRGRLKKRAKRLKKPWRQGFGNRYGYTFYNPINRLRRRFTNNKLARLKARH
jgi:hypothetical protein